MDLQRNVHRLNNSEEGLQTPHTGLRNPCVQITGWDFKILSEEQKWLFVYASSDLSILIKVVQEKYQKR